MTDAGGATATHLLYALSIDDGSTRAGWPVDLNARVSSGGIAFDSNVQNQRAALALVDGTVYVAYGGHYGDCGNYYGWVIGVPINDPTSLGTFRTRDQGVAIWAPGGISSDGTHLYGGGIAMLAAPTRSVDQVHVTIRRATRDRISRPRSRSTRCSHP